MSAHVCTCPVTPESECLPTWRDIGDGFVRCDDCGAIRRQEKCPTCHTRKFVADEFDDEEIIPDRRFSGPPSFRAYHVTILDCGHQIVEDKP